MEQTAPSHSDKVQTTNSESPTTASNFVDPVRVPAADPLVVHALQGQNNRLVVSLAGVGTKAHCEPPIEFIGSASDGNQNHALFISDSSRCWLQNPDIVENIIKLVTDYQAAHDIDDLVLLGNSMGGFAALVLADFLPAKTVIAFSPQYSAHNALVPEERRWRLFRKKIKTWIHPDVGPLSQKDTQYYIYHGDHNDEVIHWARFPKAKNIHHLIIKGADHRVVTKLNRRRLVKPIIQMAIKGRPRALRRKLEMSLAGQHLKVFIRDHYEQTHPEVIGSIA